MKFTKGISKANKLSSFFIVFILLLILQLSALNLTAQKPQTVIIDSITVDNDQIRLTWIPNNDDTFKYIIFRKTWNGTYYIWDSIDQVLQIDPKIYYDNAVDPCIESRTYAIIAKNTANLYSDFQDTKITKSIYLYDPKIDTCKSTVDLTWTSYLNMTDGLEGYKILARENTGPFVELGEVSPDDTTFVHGNLSSGTQYTYYIRGFGTVQTRTSSSCKNTIEVITPKQPEFAYIRYATVEDNDHIKVEWVVDETAAISQYNILRSDDGISFDTIYRIPDLTSYNPPKIYKDEDADFNSQSYYYEIRVFNSCGVDMLASVNFAKTIYLKGFPSLSGTMNQLEWNAYEGWDRNEVQEYNIYRKVDDVPNPSGILAAVDGLTTSYIDDVSSLSNLEGSFSYYVEAIEMDGFNGFEDFKDQSISNEVTIEQETTVLIPNAFGPDMAPPDNEFKPLMAFIDTEGYQLSIFNKWGQMLFETNDPNQGWDGRFNGNLVPTDAYVYLIVYRTPEGQTVENRGTVTVLR